MVCLFSSLGVFFGLLWFLFYLAFLIDAAARLENAVCLFGLFFRDPRIESFLDIPQMLRSKVASS